MTNTTWLIDSADTGGTGTTALFAGHLSTMNVLFADGHVKSMKPLQTVTTGMGGSGTYNMWNRLGNFNTGGEAYAERVIQYVTVATQKYQ